MVDVQMGIDEIHFLLRFLPRELGDIGERMEEAIANDEEHMEKLLTSEENACKRLLRRCQHAYEKLAGRST